MTMTIAGRAVAAPRSLDVEDPATEELITSVPNCSDQQLDEAMVAAQSSFRSWRADRAQRQRSLHAAARAVEQAATELASLITLEQGKPLAESRAELTDAVGDLRYFADLDVGSDVLRDDQGLSVRVVRRPIGPVAAITPWNFPLGTAICKVAPALAAGCTMVLKPSPYTPLSCLRFGELVSGIFPPGVLNVVSGDDAVGARMTQHPVPRMVTFTGSVATGKRVASAAAADLKRTTLELGGNDPAIVLDDVDVERVADGIFANAFSNAGQVCVAIKRVYVPERQYPAMLEALGARAAAVTVGDGLTEGTQMGPLSNALQSARVGELLREALDGGARVVSGGGRLDRRGYFLQPTVLSHVDERSRIVQEEQFGPVLPVMSYRSLSEVLGRANGSHFGLGASVWTSDPERAAALADEIECGTLWVNTHQAAIPGQPFGGRKWSGIGVEGGHWGQVAFTELQVIHVARSGV